MEGGVVRIEGCVVKNCISVVKTLITVVKNKQFIHSKPSPLKSIMMSVAKSNWSTGFKFGLFR